MNYSNNTGDNPYPNNDMDSRRTQIVVTHFEDLLDRIAKFEAFTIAGNRYTAEWLIPQLVVNSANIIDDVSVCSAHALYWGLAASRARRYKAAVDASYRQWRDRLWLQFKSEPLKSTGKIPADSVCEKLYRSTSEYGEWRTKLDDGQEAAELAEAIFEAFKLKVQLLKVQQGILNAEAGGPYYVAEKPRQMPGRFSQGGQNV
jgi:hypothetical protein